jgi:hypothetical protein
VVNGCEYSPRVGVPSAHVDNNKAAQEAELYGIGHRRINCLPLASPLSRDRRAATRAKALGASRQLINHFSIDQYPPARDCWRSRSHRLSSA